MLGKAADCEGPADERRDITNSVCVFREEIPIPVIDEGDPAPPEYTGFSVNAKHMTRSNLRRHVDATRVTSHERYSATVMVDRIARIHSLQP